MIPKNIFRENERIEVFDNSQNIYYKSIIQEINRDNIAIGVPMGKQGQLFLYRGEMCSFRIISKEAHYYFKSKVLGRKYSGRIPLYLISWPEEVKRVQQRAFFRFPCSFNIDYWILQTGDTGEDNSSNNDDASNVASELTLEKEQLIEAFGPPEKGLMADISGGGLQLVTGYNIPKGSILALLLPLHSKKEKKIFLLKGKVVWAGNPKDEKIKRHRHAVEFIDINEKLREELIRFIFILSRERIPL